MRARDVCQPIATLVVYLVLGFVGFCGATTGYAADAEKMQFHIPSQDLQAALNQFALQSKRDVLFTPAIAASKRSAELNGEYDARTALQLLLAGTGLTFRTPDQHTILIDVASAATSNAGPADAGDARMAKSDVARDQASRTTAPNSTFSANRMTYSDDPEKTKLGEIVVTAQKRAERIQDVPVPVTAISAGALLERNELRLQDYYASVPGLSYSTDFRGEPLIAIRGITTGSPNPTVGVMVDDVPYGSSTGIGTGYTAPDIDPSDLARIEVLRGPQGTLYGASSIGGLLKFVTVDPSTDSVSGHIQAGIDEVVNGPNLGYSFRGAINVPLSDTVAIRASGFTRHDPGYIDNVTTGQRGINEVSVDGGRLSALWRPSEALSLKVNALIQDSNARGISLVNVGLGDLQQNDLRGTGAYSRETQAYSANLTGKVGVLDITVLSGYNVDSLHSSTDYTAYLGPSAQKLFGVAGAALTDDRKTTKFTQEIRVSAPVSERIDWLFGGFYTHERSPAEQAVIAIDPSTGGSPGALLEVPFPSTYQEYAIFTDLTFRITDQFDVQVGGRESENKQTYSQITRGALVGADIVAPEVDSKGNAFTYLVTPRFKVSPDLMVYARLASGYRPGGPNLNTKVFNLPPTYNPDKTLNYEVGVKGDALDRLLSFDASIYYIDWKDIQVDVYDAAKGLTYFANASRAKSEGVELSVESRPLVGLVVAGWVAWNEAVLTEGFPATSLTVGNPGDRLPNSSRLSANLSIDQTFPLVANATGFIGASLSYAGDRDGAFQSSPAVLRLNFPGYAKTDFRLGARVYSWSGTLTVANLTDRRGVLGIGLFPTEINYIQPRTVGLSFMKSF